MMASHLYDDEQVRYIDQKIEIFQRLQIEK